MIITWPATAIRDTIESIIDAVGRDVEFFYVYSTYECPACDLDPVTGTSVDSFCETCSGEYYIDIYSGETMKAHVTWKYDFKNEFETGGKVFIGDAQAKVMHTAERESLIKETKYLVVDGKTMDIIKTTTLGTPINRVIVHLKEREE